MRIRPLVLILALLEFVPSVFLWLISPTDSVRVWYVSWLSYAGEHAVASFTLFVVLLPALQSVGLSGNQAQDNKFRDLVGLGFRTYLFLAVVLLAMDTAASLIIGTIQIAATGEVSLWHSRRLIDFLAIRESFYTVAMAFSIAVLTIGKHVRAAVSPEHHN